MCVPKALAWSSKEIKVSRGISMDLSIFLYNSLLESQAKQLALHPQKGFKTIFLKSMIFMIISPNIKNQSIYTMECKLENNDRRVDMFQNCSPPWTQSGLL